MLFYSKRNRTEHRIRQYIHNSSLAASHAHFALSHFIIAQPCNAVFQHHHTIVAQHSRPFLHHFSLFVAIHCRSSQPRSKPSQHHRRRNAHRRQRSFISQPISIRVCRKSQRPVNIHWALAVLKIKSQNVAQCKLMKKA